MMLFKLSLKNIRKCFKDYAIYFITLILGVAIFYVFNALDSQKAMLRVSESTKEIIRLMLVILSGVSVCVAVILGFLIIYANNFLVKRRKKEFAIYMTLGMGKREVSRILFGETILIGILSLAVGLVIGVFASQFMSILVAKMFESDLTAYTFAFSRSSTLKTIVYFGVMYLIVILFNAVSISRYKLIDLFQASKKTESRRVKSSGIAVLVFVAAISILGYAYYQVTVNFGAMNNQKVSIMIVLGCIGTYLVFWSLSGFLLNLLRRCRSFYNSGLNAFVLRQVNSNINTAVFSMTVICLLFFVTICVLSTGLSLNNAFRKDLQKNCPADVNMFKDMIGEGADAGLTVEQAMVKAGFSMENFLPGYVEISQYYDPAITLLKLAGDHEQEVQEKYAFIRWNAEVAILGISEYNSLAALYGRQTYELEEDEYIVIATMRDSRNINNLALADGNILQVGEHTLRPRYSECQDGLVTMNISNAELGTILVPDAVIQAENGKSLQKVSNLLTAEYVGETKEEKQAVEALVLGIDTDKLDIALDGMTRIVLYESSVGLSAIATFIAIYLGIIFLIAGAALLALKELSESTDNRQRYAILQKIGCDRSMQHHALLWQMGIFFGIPMLLAIVHSVFGIRFASNLLAVYSLEDVVTSIVMTAVVLVFIYGAYFTATYFGSRRIIEEH